MAEGDDHCGSLTSTWTFTHMHVHMRIHMHVYPQTYMGGGREGEKKERKDGVRQFLHRVKNY